MLQLHNIIKDYVTPDNTVHALKGITLSFRRSEFVSILGQSGCGKTTLLNIIGGLDRYTDGDLIIDGVSTKDYKDRDWDNYRNHKIGFIFQSYNLIPHQTVLGNVELALTLSGVSKVERKNRAIEALNKVGLGDLLKKKPNQLSGGQMQRVAIARAIVNNPTIILADEPTGALDTETSVQVMEILKEISKDRLVIMVTHNPELAEKYSTRIVNLSDGLLEGDSKPYEPSEEEVRETLKEIGDTSSKDAKEAQKLSKMSVITAFGLSARNLLTKKARTFLTSFAGSIGIIGIALILSMSSGFQNYIDNVQEQTLSSYPLTVQESSVHYSGILESLSNTSSKVDVGENEIGVSSSMKNTLKDLQTSTYTNDLKTFKKFLEGNSEDAKTIRDASSSIQYSYDMNVNTYYEYNDGTSTSIVKVNPNSLYSTIASSVMGSNVSSSLLSSMGLATDVFGELLPNVDGSGLYNEELLNSQYDLISGSYPTSYDEVLFVVNENNTISDYAYYALGLAGDYKKVLTSGAYEKTISPLSYSDILNIKYKVILPGSTYVKDGEPLNINGQSVQLYKDNLSNETLSSYYSSAEIEMKVVGIIRPKANLAATALTSTIAYSPKLTLKAMELNKQTEVYLAQSQNSKVSVISGKILSDSSLTLEERVEAYLSTLSTEEANAKRSEFNDIAVKTYFKTSFETTVASLVNFGIDIKGVELEYNDLDSDGNVTSNGTIKYETLNDLYQNVFEVNTLQSFIETYIANTSRRYTQYIFIDSSGNKLDLSSLMESKGISVYYLYAIAYNYALNQYYGNEFETYDSVMETLEVCSEDSPSTISFYAKSFQDKDRIISSISNYNTKYPTKTIDYTDYVGVMMSSITTILNAVTYVLIGFVSISLIVSSIMIAIITYISVLERTKEIGILRSIGASKRDVSNIFNAETIFIGLLSGVIGVLSCVVLDIPINIIINNIATIGSIAVLPWQGGLALIAISILLSFIAGLIPAKIAATRDPVIALRSE